MLWYAETRRRRTRQVVGDLLALVWVVLWVLLARAVHGAVSALSAPAGPLRDAGSGLEQRMDAVAGTVVDVPVVGERLSAPFSGAAGVGVDLVAAGDSLESSVDRLAMLMGVGTVGLPILLVLAYLLLRVRYARRAGLLARERGRPELQELLALRALVGQPTARVSALAPDPLGAWRSGDPEVVGRLVALELRGMGLRPGPALATD
ncbi:hypothetical protein [Ornithinimicrobium sediminis]|uniref:hypothetical protein n=1 Tax=Ornithinimicrobium sediminis TaxID=2904603 RepID=UPI001E544567|nr:hypothetical protein [Ornithinimicrobium sediminis]MCE0487750.1 hypothetical protein [Ornithinimicrobium sediminis]